jgi:hypothetical protein
LKIKYLTIALIFLIVTTVFAQDNVIFKEVPLTGKLVTAEDPITIGDNFQQLTNMRYRRSNPVGISGMSEINTTAVTSVEQMTNGYHFIKHQPAESHVLIQGRDGSDANPIIFQNTTAIPSQGAMSGGATPTALYTEDTSAGMARFSSAPGGNVAICDSVDCLLWGGDESQIRAFITSTATITATTITNPRDYTDEVKNTLTESAERAIIGGGNDSSTVVLYHFDGADASTTITDSSIGGAAHNGTAVDDMQLDIDQAKFGMTAGLFDGTGDWITFADHADVDFSADVFSIDFWLYINTMPSGADYMAFCGQRTDNDNGFGVSTDTNGALFLHVVEAGGSASTYSTSSGLISAGQWLHIAVTGDGSNYYLFVDGTLSSTDTIVESMVDYTQIFFVGGAESTNFFSFADTTNGWIDEFRLSKSITRWTATFTPPSRPYHALAHDWLVGSLIPLDGVKFYIPSGNENTVASTLTGTFWNGQSWTSLTTFTDNTDTGASLAQTGTVTWDSTVDLAKPKYIEGLYLYWYNFNLDAGEAELYHVTTSAPMQKINDMWDMEYVSLTSAAWYNAAYTNSELPIYEVDYVASDLTTYWNLNAVTAAQYPVFGFTERMTALNIEFAANATNTAAATSTVYYWDGSAWASVGTITDGTLDSGGTKTFNTSGVISWNAPDASQEFTTSISDSPPLYFYKVTHSAQFAATDIFVDYVAGIPASKTIDSYKFSIHSKDRLFLCSEQSQDKNKCIASAIDTANVFNGDDYIEFWFGDEKELMGGTSLYSRLGSSLYEVTLFFKRDKIYGLTGTDADSFTQYLINDSVGLTAPLTLKTTTVQMKNLSKPIAIWQGADGINMFDNSSVILISEDISNFFDDNESASRRLHASYIDDSVSCIDHDNHEYHWLFADGNSTGLLNREFVFDYILLKWYEIDRGVGDTGGDKDDLQSCFSVRDTTGNYYTYGLTDEGDMLRLENGTTFDGDNMTFTLWTGAWTPVEGSIMYNTKPIRHKLLMKSKASTTSTVAITHYLDRKTTGTSLTVADPTNANFAIADVLQEGNVIYVPGIFHSFKYVITTNNETVGFEPLAIGTKFHIVDEDIY